MTSSVTRVTFFLLFLLIGKILVAQPSLHVFNIDPSDYPVVRGEFYAYDEDRTLIRDLTVDDMTVDENLTSVPILSITCPEPQTPPDISAVLAIDISGSMNERLKGQIRTRLDVVKEAANLWVETMRYEPSACAITSFNNLSYVNQHFSYDKARLSAAINSLRADGGTSYDMAMMGWPAGGLVMARAGAYKRVLVFLTDGMGDFADDQRVIDYALQNNIEVYCLAFGMQAPDILRRLSRETGGLYFEFLEEPDKIKAIYKVILERVQGEPPCKIEWLSKGDCFNKTNYRIASFGIPQLNVGDVGYYYVENQTTKFPSIAPSHLLFGAVPPGLEYRLQTEIKAVGGEITVRDIVGTNPLFSVVELEGNPNFLPKKLQQDEKLTLTIRYSPQDTSVVSGEFTILTDACEDPVLYCAGGYRNPQENDLHLVHPDGGEVFIAGSDTVIRWDGVLPTDPVSIEYSIDGGTTWDTVAKDVTGLSYPWHVPNTPSNTCLARVKQQLPNTHISVLPHTFPVVDVAFMPDGRQVVTLEENGQVNVWDGLKGKVVLRTSGASRASQLAVSPDGRLAAVGNAIDRSMVLWDLNTGELLDVYPNSYVNGEWFGNGTKGIIAFLPDSRRIISVATSVRQDSILQIRDVTTGTIVREIQDGRLFYRYGTFSPDGAHFAIAGKGGLIQIWDSELTTVEKEWYDPIGDIQMVAFSYDSKELVTATTSHTVTTWDLQGGVLHRFYLPNIPLYDLDYDSPDRNVLISSQEATLRSTRFGTIQRTFPGHLDRINASDINGQGTLIVTASQDKTARVWVNEEIEVEADQSDSLWAIVIPTAVSIDVDFGKRQVGVRKDSVVDGYIRNTGRAPIHITDMKVIGPYASDFAILSGNTDFVLAPDEGRNIELGFTPGNPGLRYATMRIITQADTLFQDLRGIGVVPSLKIVGLVGNLIDFGKVPVNREKDSVAIGLNVGTAPLTIDSISLVGPHPDQFLLLPGPVQMVLQPGDSIKVPVGFLPTDTGLFNGVIKLHYADITSPALVQLFGIGIRQNSPAIETWPEVSFSQQLCQSNPDSVLLPIWNPGEAPLRIEEILLDGDPSFGLDPVSLPLTLPVGDTTFVLLRFNPGTPGRKTGTLRIKSNGSNGEELDLPVEGEFRQVLISLDRDEIDLGDLCPGELVTIRLEGKNSGGTTAFVREDISLTDSSIGELVVDRGMEKIEPDSTTIASYLFSAAQVEGVVEGTITIIDTVCGGRIDVRLHGRVRGPEIYALPVGLICGGEEVLLRAEGGERYEWSSKGETLCSDCPDGVVVTPEQTTLYYVTGYDARGCSGVDSVLVQVRERPDTLIGTIGRAYRAKPGDTVELSAQLLTSPPLWTGITEIGMEFRYDPSVLRLNPNNFAVPGRGTLLDGWNVYLAKEEPGLVELIYRSTTGMPLQGTGDLFRIRGEIYLANVIGTEIEWRLTTPAGCLMFETSNGYVAVDSICGLNYRLFEVGEAKYRLLAPYPNPVVEGELRIDFSLGLNGPTRIELIDLAGNAREVLSGHLEAGEYQARVMTTEMEAGFYFLRIESGDWNQVRKIRVLK